MIEMYKMKVGFEEFKPFLSSENLKIHYYDLYGKYTKELNKQISSTDFDPFEFASKKVTLKDESILRNLGGYINHTLFFENLIPYNYPTTLEYNHFDKIVDEQFGSKNKLQECLISVINNSFGSNYVILANDESLNLEVLTIKNQNIDYLRKYNPLLVIDVWEHSYYLDYYSKKNEYSQAIVKLLNYKIANKRLEQYINKRIS